MRTIISSLALIGLAVLISLAAAAGAEVPNFVGTYKGTFVPTGMRPADQEMTLSIGEDMKIVASFYNWRRAGPGMGTATGAKVNGNTITFTMEYSGGRKGEYTLTLEDNALNGKAYNTTAMVTSLVNLTKVDQKACPINAERKIIAPC